MIGVLRFDPTTHTSETWLFELRDDKIQCFKYERSRNLQKCLWLLHDYEWRGEVTELGLDPTNSPPFPDDVVEEAVRTYRKKLLFHPPASTASRKVEALFEGLVRNPDGVEFLLDQVVLSVLDVAPDLTDDEWVHWTRRINKLVDDPKSYPQWPVTKPTRRGWDREYTPATIVPRQD